MPCMCEYTAAWEDVPSEWNLLIIRLREIWPLPLNWLNFSDITDCCEYNFRGFVPEENSTIQIHLSVPNKPIVWMFRSILWDIEHTLFSVINWDPNKRNVVAIQTENKWVLMKALLLMPLVARWIQFITITMPTRWPQKSPEKLSPFYRWHFLCMNYI